MDRNQKLSAHFNLGELIKSETAERKNIDNSPPEHLIPKLKRLCEKILEPVRIHYGKPFRPNSGYRGPILNAEVGGSKTSQHCHAEAVDLEVSGVSNYDLAVWIKDNLEFDQLILECYKPGEPTSGWVHVSLKDEGQQNRKKVNTYTGGKYLSGLVV